MSGKLSAVGRVPPGWPPPKSMIPLRPPGYSPKKPTATSTGTILPRRWPSPSRLRTVASRSVGSALAAALEARAHAVRGDAKQTHRALAHAEETLGALDPESTIDVSAFGYNEAQLRFHQSNALTHLGDTKSALAVQDRALELTSPADFMDRAFVRLDRAACLLRDGDHSGAASFALECMLALSAEQRRGIIAGRARNFSRQCCRTGARAPPPSIFKIFCNFQHQRAVARDYYSASSSRGCRSDRQPARRT